MSKEFKYQRYLDKYKNCPKDCREKDLPAYRWIHKEINEHDFSPININPNLAYRAFDSTDSMCMSYGLSLYQTLKAAITQYLNFYNKIQRQPQRIKYKQDKGDHVARLKISKNNGVCSGSNLNEHFTFYEYIGCNLINNVIEKFDIFVYNGTVSAMAISCA